MSGKRVLALYVGLLLGFTVVVCRLFGLCTNAHYAARAAGQSVVTLPLPARRGNFYDCENHLLTGLQTAWYALCLPGTDSYARLYPYADAAGQAMLYQKRNVHAPFLVEVNANVSPLGISCYPFARRYAAAPLCAHLLGYCDGEGKGEAGLEAAFDALLTGSGRGDAIRCNVNAQGKLRAGEEPQLLREDSGALGVRITISREIQRAVETAAAQTMTRGCVVVLDAASAKVRACVSLPGFDPETVSDSLDKADSPLVNRAFQSYAVGSVFKPVLAAAALETGKDDLVYDCPGYLVVDGQVFRCAGGIPHGEVDLAAALEKSCNGYFIRLGQELGAACVRALAGQLGFGKAQEWTGTYRTSAGNLPKVEQLTSSGQYANFCFGQGELLATPLQIAGMMNAIASDGKFRTPQILDCVLNETTGEVQETLAHRKAERVVSPQTAARLRELLAGVVAEGTGYEAAPGAGTAGGKTGTAQTGQFAQGVELKNYWFAGFYPAEAPRWTIVVLQDGQNDPGASSAAVFARVCDALEVLQVYRKSRI